MVKLIRTHSEDPAQCEEAVMGSREEVYQNCVLAATRCVGRTS